MVRITSSGWLAIVLATIATGVVLVGATGTVVAEDDRACAPYCSTGPTIPDDPMQSTDGDALAPGIASDLDDEPCWADGDFTDCGGTGPTNPNPE